MKKKLTLVVALVLILAISVGGTLAYLTYTTDAVTNTFTVGNVKITLAETNVDEGAADANSYKMIPGSSISKDPKITVDSTSENCYVFVKVEKLGNASVTVNGQSVTKGFDDYISYNMADGWTPVDSVNNVFVYSDGDNSISAGTEITVLKNNQVTVNSTVTQEMMDALGETGAVQPQLKITAYAVQFENVKTVADAWIAISGS